MAVWRYKAIAMGASGAVQTGELAGESAADVRAALRRARLQVIEIRPLRARRPLLVSRLDRHLRARRREIKADLLDSLSTMLESGLPLTECLDALIESSRRSTRSMLMQVRESIRAGRDMADALGEHASWFDAVEVSLVRAGQHAGDLAGVLRTLSARHARSGELTHKLIGALAYPALVACVGVAVVIFLSLKTLPDLVRILDGAGIETPRLTALVMAFGSATARYGPWLTVACLLLLVPAAPIGAALRRRGVRPPALARRAIPVVVRRLSVARVATGLSELLRAGVPAVEALRVLAPSVGVANLRARLDEAASRIERGEQLAEAMDDPHWFDAEFRRLLAVGESAGELDRMLSRIGERYERRARLLIDRLAALLEPAVILALAAVIGVVVIASVLPLLRLQEVL